MRETLISQGSNTALADNHCSCASHTVEGGNHATSHMPYICLGELQWYEISFIHGLHCKNDRKNHNDKKAA